MRVCTMNHTRGQRTWSAALLRTLGVPTVRAPPEAGSLRVVCGASEGHTAAPATPTPLNALPPPPPSSNPWPHGLHCPCTTFKIKTPAQISGDKDTRRLPGAPTPAGPPPSSDCQKYAGPSKLSEEFCGSQKNTMASKI